MSEYLDYLYRLRRQFPEVERLRDEAAARGDTATVRNSERLLADWSTALSRVNPANDIEPARKPLARTVGAETRNDGVFDRLALFVMRNVGSLWLAFRDERTPWYAKAIAVLACFLAVSPIDFTPDRIPAVGYFDDPTLLIVGTILAARLISPLLIAEYRDRAASVEQAQAIKGSFAICSIWLVAILMTALHVWRPVY